MNNLQVHTLNYNKGEQRNIFLTNRNHLLNEHKTSWINLMKLDDQNEFEQLWTSLKPSEKLEIKIAGKIIDCPHYFRS